MILSQSLVLQKCEFSFFLKVENVNILGSVYGKDKYGRANYLLFIHLNAAMRLTNAVYQANFWGALYIFMTWKGTVLWPIRKTKRMRTDHRDKNGNLFKNLIQRVYLFIHFIKCVLFSPLKSNFRQFIWLHLYDIKIVVNT